METGLDILHVHAEHGDSDDGCEGGHGGDGHSWKERVRQVTWLEEEVKERERLTEEGKLLDGLCLQELEFLLHLKREK